MRLFVAIEAAPAWRDAALEARRGIEAALDADDARALRWVAPDLMHVTLSFLGEVEESHLDALRDALDEVARAEVLSLRTEAPAIFGRPDRARVVWLALAGDAPALDALATDVDRAARAGVGLEPPCNAPNPHLTLARVRERATREARRAIARAVEDVAPVLAPSEEVAVERIVLVRSHLGPRGPRYEVLSKHGLSDRGGPTDDRDAGREVDAPQAGA
ncbi:MAG: RNA 2',3'-cyclic phosphodiesterase [Dehalococcoidia bacterium]